MQAEKVQIAKDADERIAAGGATMYESLATGMKRTVDAWGNAQQHMVKLGGDITNAISSGIGNALSSIVDGTKTAKQAFTDMAISILKDISNMIIKMLVELAVQYLINAARGYANGGAAGGGGGAGSGSASQVGTDSSGNAVMSGNTGNMAGYATGGPTGRVSGGRGGVDDIPAMLTAGEFVIKKDSVDKYGLRYLNDLNEGRVHKYAMGGMVGSGGGTRDARSVQNNVNVSINTSSRAGNKSDVDEKADLEEKGKRIKSMVIAILGEERRQGGMLSRQ